MEVYKGGEHFAVVIILCVFEYAMLRDLQAFKQKLLHCMPKMIDHEGNETPLYQDAYISISSILNIFGGKLYITEDGERCIGLGDTRMAALKNLWEQFPSLRDSITKWLINLYDTFEYTSNFDATRIINAFVTIFKIDFSAGETGIFPKLYSNPNRLWLLGAIALDLYNDLNNRNRILPILKKWLVSSSTWLWKSTCLVYSYMDGTDEESSLCDDVHKSIKQRCRSFESVDYHFVGMLLIHSNRLRSLISNIFRELTMQTPSRQEAILFGNMYMEYLKYGYYSVSHELPALPLVACDTKEQQTNLQPLISIILPIYRIRQILFAILEAYIKEISAYTINTSIINHIKAFFALSVISSPRHKGDLLLLLQKCNCDIANDIACFLKLVAMQEVQNNE